MAIQTKNFVTGTLGNVIFYESGGQHLARMRPAKVKQAVNTKKRSINFGVAQRAGKILRPALRQVLHFPLNKSMQSRFSGAISKWLGHSDLSLPEACMDIASFHDFNFNRDSNFRERFKVPLQFDFSQAGRLKITLPSFVPVAQISAPAHCSAIQLTITVAACQLLTSTGAGSETFTCNIPFNEKQQPGILWVAELVTGKEYLVIAAASLTYILTNGQPEKRTAFMPSAVLQAVYL